MQDFRHIRAWQRAHALAIAIHKLARGFSRLGYGNLRSQLTRSADSIGATIIEGCGAETNKEFARFLDMSIKSANETEGHLLKARDLSGFRAPGKWVIVGDATKDPKNEKFLTTTPGTGEARLAPPAISPLRCGRGATTPKPSI